MRHYIKELIIGLILFNGGLFAEAFQPHTALVSSGKGFATHTTAMGAEPRPQAGHAYPDLVEADDRIDHFHYSVEWKEHPPLTKEEAVKLSGLEAWASGVADPPTADPSQFAQLQWLQTKLHRFLNAPAELVVKAYVVHIGHWPDASDKGYYGQEVILRDIELTVDLSDAPVEPPYFPGQPINHTPEVVTVAGSEVHTLPKPWEHRWQPIKIRGSFDNFRTPIGSDRVQGSGSLTLHFRRHQSRLMTFGTLHTDRDGKFSVATHATYNGEGACYLPKQVAPSWYTSFNRQTNSWSNNYIDWNVFNLNYANYGASSPDPLPLPDFNRPGDSPCEAVEPIVITQTVEVPVPVLQMIDVIKEVEVIKEVPVPCDHKQKGNNGVGNGLDPQPPGNPKVNDGPGTSPGNPGARKAKKKAACKLCGKVRCPKRIAHARAYAAKRRRR